MDQFLHYKGHEQQPAAQQQRIDQPGIEPIQAVALIEGGIDQAKPQARIDDSRPMRGLILSSSRFTGWRGIPK